MLEDTEYSYRRSVLKMHIQTTGFTKRELYRSPGAWEIKEAFIVTKHTYLNDLSCILVLIVCCCSCLNGSSKYNVSRCSPNMAIASNAAPITKAIGPDLQNAQLISTSSHQVTMDMHDVWVGHDTKNSYIRVKKDKWINQAWATPLTTSSKVLNLIHTSIS